MAKNAVRIWKCGYADMAYEARPPRNTQRVATWARGCEVQRWFQQKPSVTCSNETLRYVPGLPHAPSKHAL